MDAILPVGSDDEIPNGIITRNAALVPDLPNGAGVDILHGMHEMCILRTCLA